ncbi:hypothetical protein [Nocardioides sp.]
MTTKRTGRNLIADAAFVVALAAVFVILLTRGDILHWIGLV